QELSLEAQRAPSSGQSTFCAIISQLTEETQPLFETTIKSRAVSEDSDAKFTCIVTGYPQPEVTWYKDDEEMDRYCGLPKYEIFRHGNRHTLQLYKCREEDAGIYQASARNNKGIVSCSGVLEVGTMTEFKIHQRWFDKIKRKAEEKMQEIEQGKKRGKENVEVEKLQGMSPERLQRKRRLARDQTLRSGDSSWEKEDTAKVHEQPVSAVPGFPNKLVAPLKAEVTTNGDATLESGEENGNSFLTYIYETVEDLATKPGAKDSAAKKKKKVEAPSAPKQEVSKREESGRDRANQSSNPRFAPPVPLRRNARLRAASDQEVETSPKLKEPGKAVKQDIKSNDDMYFSLKDMYFDKQVKPVAGKEEVGAKDETVKDGKSKEEGAELSGSHPGVRTGESDAAEPCLGAVHREAGGTPLGRQNTQNETAAPASVPLAKEKPLPAPAVRPSGAQEAMLASNRSPGMEATAGEALSGAQLLPPARGETEITMTDGSVPREVFSAITSEEENAKPVPMGPQGKEGGLLRATALYQEPAASSGTWEGVSEVQPQVPLVLPGSERSQEMSVEEKMQHKNLVSSLKNYLLLLLKMSDSSKDATKGDTDSGDKEQPNAGEGMIPEIGIAGLSPRTSRKVLEKVQNNQLFQTAENLPLTPRTSRRITGMINEEFLTSQEMLACRPGPPPLSVPSIVVGSMPTAGAAPHLSDLPPGSSEESPADPLAVLPCATPEELALGARRKIYLPKPKQVGVEEEAPPESLGHTRGLTVSPRQSRRNASLLHSPAPAPSSPSEQCSPTLTRKMATLEVPKLYEEPAGDTGGDEEVPGDAKPEAQPAESQSTNNPFKAPQVVRKIRAEQFSDASGNLKLWCQFFNILSDSKLTWYKDEIPVAEAQRSSGDEGQAALAVVQASQKDCGVYRCVISNEYGTDSTDFLLSPEVLSGFILREEIEVGEEIEMTPMVFAKGLADAGYWGDKLFGRVVSEDVEVGAGFLRKACRARAIYGLEPVFESGHTCVIKVHNFIVFGTKNENSLIEKNYDITIQECKVQNSSREYCKIFAAEARAVPDFGAVPEIIPLYLIYRPANNIPYATMEEDLGGPCEQYCVTERDGSLVARGTSEIVLKCCTFQHWVYQWTNGNILVTDMEGVGWKLTNVRIATNLKGYQGLKESCFPSLLEQFPAAHRCNHYCSILGLKMLEPAKPKGSKSPCLGRKSAQSSPQLQKKVLTSPQSTRKASVSPKSSRRAAETGEASTACKPRSGESNRAGCRQ
uniref:non-specific serine/threonine protein kinase n=1 Tax=Serinus canaria TaxID=9135 RepID=A0A8C9NUW1_SERCA